MNIKSKWYMLLPLSFIPITHAEVSLDGSMGASAQKVFGPNYYIHEGLGQRQGANLFHSFSQFNINAGETATFIANGQTKNILARVTGGTPSLIDGTITSDSAANLWLMNSAGWVVGKNAQLNVQGSFHLSTADAIGFEGGGMFYADPVSQSVLSAAAPIDYQFNAGQQAKITINQADLEVPENKTLSIVGGDIEMKNSHLTAPGGALLLASNVGQGQWHFDNKEIAQVNGAKGTIRIEHDEQASIINTPSLASSKLDGEIEVSAGILQLTAQQIHLKNVYLAAHAGDNKHAEDTTFRAHQIFLDASIIDSKAEGSKDGGNVYMIANHLELKNNSRIETVSDYLREGKGGNINIDLTGQLTMSSESSLTSTTLGSTGGDVNINTQSILLTDGSSIQATTRSNSNAGDLNIVTNQFIIDGINNNYKEVLLSTATLPFGDDEVKGHAGNISIKANNMDVQGSIINSESRTEGSAGTIDIQTNNLSLANITEIRGASLASGQSGAIHLKANNLLKVQNSSVNTIAVESDGGPIVVDSQSLMLDHSIISTSVFGEQGNGGNIDVNTDTLVLHGGFIQANTAAVGARGGTIQLNAKNTLASQEQVLIGGSIRQEFDPTFNSNLNVIQAAAPDGVNGQINSSTVELNIAGQLAKVDSSFSSKNNIAKNPCQVSRNEKMSSLIQVGQGGLPTKANDPVNLPLQRHLSTDQLPPQSQLNSDSITLAFLSASDVCKQDIN